MIPTEILVLIAAVFLLVSILMSKVAARRGVPVLLVFLLVGMLAGSEGIGGIYFDDPWLTQSIGVVAMAFILFAGGLDTRWADIRPVLGYGLLLSTVGVLVTAASVGGLAVAVLGFTPLEGLLLGAIIAPTDAAAVFPILRGYNLRGHLKPILELESGSNDPMAIFLTIGLLQLITQPAQPLLSLVPLFVIQMGVGALVGVVSGRGAVIFINRVRLEYEGLYSVLTIALVLFTYSITTLLGGNAFLAIYITGIIMAQQNFIHKRSLHLFHEGIAWLMQIILFVTLGLQVFPSQLIAVAGSGLLVALFVIVFARPLSVMIALVFSRIRFNKKVFIAWVGLRGATPVVLATFPLLAGIEKSQLIFNLVFFIVLSSVLIQGTLLLPVARWLNLLEQGVPSQSPLDYVMNNGMIANDLVEIVLTDDTRSAGRQIVTLDMPPTMRILLIGRGQDLIVPNGSTVLEAGDTLLMLSKPDERAALAQLLNKGAAITTDEGLKTGLA